MSSVFTREAVEAMAPVSRKLTSHSDGTTVHVRSAFVSADWNGQEYVPRRVRVRLRRPWWRRLLGL